MESREKYKETNLFNGSSYKLKVFEVSHKQYCVMRLHWHEYLELLYVVEGQPILNIGSTAYEVSAGDILFVNGRQLHSGYSQNNSHVKYYAIVLDRSLFTGDSDNDNYKKFIMPFLEGTRLFPTRLEKKHSYYRKVKSYIKMIIKEYENESPGFEIIIKFCLYSIFVELIRGYLPISPVKSVTEEHMYDVKNIKNLISHIYLVCPPKMTVRDAAQYVSLSPYYFCKVFKKTTGYTFIEFFNIYKINKAVEMLMYTNDSITNIASDLGFCNINYFDKVFKQLNGYSPSAYRKNNINSKT